jgi:4'-phosphopantetheinyl transferase
MSSKDPISTFFEIWTVKESYVKMKGTDIVVNLDSFIVNLGEKISVIDNFIKTKGNLKTWNILNNHYWMAVCSDKKLIENPKEIHLFDMINTLT